MSYLPDVPGEVVILTVAWVLLGAILIMPYFATKKMTKKGGKIDRLEKGFHKRLNRMERKFDNFKIPEVKMSEALKDLPTAKRIEEFIEKGRANTVEVINNFKSDVDQSLALMDGNIPKHIHNYLISDEFEKLRKSKLTSMAGLMGVEAKKLKNLQIGLDAAPQIIEAQLSNPDNHSDDIQIIRQAIKVGGELDLIDPTNAEQHLGMVLGTMKLINMYQNRKTQQGNGSGFLSTPLSPSNPLSTQGNNMVYR